MIEFRGGIKPAIAAAVLSVVTFAGGAPEPSRELDSRRRSRMFEFTYTVSVPQSTEGSQRLDVWIPVPQQDPFQKVVELKVTSPQPYQLKRDAEYGNRFIYLRLDDEAGWKAFNLALAVTIERFEHRALGAGRSPSASSWLDAAGTARFLQPDRLVPLDGPIAEVAREEVDATAGAIERARQVYDYVVSTVRYDKSGEGWGRGDALFACDEKRGNCTDFHSLFIGLLRTVGVPARFEIGFALPPDDEGGTIGGYHCWASFYVEGSGWIPVDASEAWKYPEKRDYYFGALDENRVLFSLGRDIRLTPAPQAGPLNYFIYPHVEVDGRPIEVETRFAYEIAPR